MDKYELTQMIFNLKSMKNTLNIYSLEVNNEFLRQKYENAIEHIEKAIQEIKGILEVI